MSSSCTHATGVIGSDGILTADSAKFEELQSYVASLTIANDKEQNRRLLIPALRRAQDIYTFLPESVQLFVADSLKLHLSEVYGVISFYSYFTTEEPRKHKVSVCCGTACHVKGATTIMDAVMRTVGLSAGAHTTEDKLFTIERVSCVGACGLAPVVLVNDEVYGQATPEQIAKIVKQIKDAETK
jgi:NADH-quinone oxidoreductase subunit E